MGSSGMLESVTKAVRGRDRPQRDDSARSIEHPLPHLSRRNPSNGSTVSHDDTHSTVSLLSEADHGVSASSGGARFPTAASQGWHDSRRQVLTAHRDVRTPIPRFLRDREALV